MQVETSTVTASSSPLSSLVSSSVPSIEPAPPIAGARAKVTYSRKPLAPGNESSSSSQPASPSNNLFDSPMRSYGRNATSLVDHDANDITITNDTSPATTAPAGNSAVKIGASSLFRRVDSHQSQNSIDDDEQHQQQSSTESPAVNRTKKFQLGMARAIFDSDSDSESEGGIGTKLTSRPLVSNDDQDDDEVIARIRAQTFRDADSDPFTGSLSSVPPSSSQAQSSLHRSSNDAGDEQMADASREESANLSRPRGSKISAMKGKGDKASRSKSSESSDKEGSAHSDEDDDQVQARKPRTFKLVSSASSASSDSTTPVDQDASVNNEPALTRRDKVAALAAKARKAHGEAEINAENNAEAEPLLDAFFGGGSPGRIPSRSPSLDIQGSDEDEHNDAMPAFMAPNSRSAVTKPKARRPKKQAAVERDILSDLEDDPKHTSKRASAPKEKAPPKIKPLSKKEIDAMHKQTARLARENRSRLAPTHQKKTIGLNELLSKIRAGEAFRTHGSQGANASNSADTASDSSAQPSSQIPSGQSKSQHASDPIESDPIPERSSPHPGYSSSPVVPISRQQERRLGLDPSSSNANILQNGAAGRVAGLATRQGQSHQHLLLEDDEDAQLPDLASLVKQSRDQQEADKEAARKKQELQQMKLRFLQRSRQQASASNGTTPKQATSAKPAHSDAGDDDDLEVYQPGSVLAAKHNLPTTPGKKRPTELLYREIGIRPGKTPPGRKTYLVANAKGSPNADDRVDHIEMADGHDELVVTDSQLRTAGKGLFIAADKAAGEMPTTQAKGASTLVRPDAEHPTRQTGPRSGPVKLTQAQLNAKLMREMQSQILKARSQKDAKDAKLKPAGDGVDKHGRSAAPDVQAMLQRLGETANDQSLDHHDPADDDEDDPDFIMPPARSAESAVGSDVDMGSASEIDENEDVVDFGSADEDEDMDVQAAGTRDTIEEADEEHDSEKENAPPPASQQSQRSNASPSLSRSLLPSRAVMDDDEDELPAARPNARRGRRSALADDDDGDNEGELQPGPFDRNRGTIAEEPSQSQGRSRVPLGDISSQSIDQSMPFSRSNTTSPAIQHAQPPRRDPLVVPLSAGHDEDESFRTDDIPSQAADLGRFFEPTMPPSTAKVSTAPRSFWDQTQTQDATQSQSQLPPASDRPALARDASANSALGAFFHDTQQEDLRGESLDIFSNPKVVGGKAPGFTQFFFDGTPPPSASASWDASTMPPPKSTGDAFAALRRAQMSDAGMLDPTPSLVPLDESQAEREVYAMAQKGSPEKMYMNRDGFFTQTKPTQVGAGMWSQYEESQSQSQSQLRVRRASDTSHIGGDEVVVFEEEDEEDEPVQLKRLRRGARFADDEPVQEHEPDEEDEENGPPSSQPEPKPRNAFDVLRQGPPSPVVRSKKRRSAFVEGEAEESDDEDLAATRTTDAGGLKGVFADDDSSHSADDSDSEDDADAPDLDTLVDNERDLDEASKDEIARARYREDMEARDREELEIHRKAVEGGFRTRRRGVGLNGIEGFLDDDADDEELKRRAMLAGAGEGWKKRKLMDGTEDGMDKLAVHEEAQAFVRGYAATHRVDHESDKYDFLTMAVEDEDESGDEEEEEQEEEDAFGPVKPAKSIGFSEVANIIRERRRAVKRNALSDDEDEVPPRENRWDTDEEADETVAGAILDRIRAPTQPPTQPTVAKGGTQYGRSSRPVAPSSSDATQTDTVEEEADDDASTSLMARLLNRNAATRAGVETLDDAEPEWGNDANIVRAPKPAASTSSTSSMGSKGMGMKTGSTGMAKAKPKTGSMLLGKQGIMRRESGFSSSSSGA